jgi:Flp pilus assembly protein TadG
MRIHLPRSVRRRRNAGVAALEFALLVPVLIALFLGVAEFSMVYHDQLQVSSALSAGAEFAFTKGQTEEGGSGGNLDTDVQTFVNSIISSNLLNATASVVVYYNGVTADGSPSSCYCPTSSPLAFNTTATCGATCSDGSTAGKFATLTASLTYTPMFSVNSVFFHGLNPFKQTITVRLQ